MRLDELLVVKGLAEDIRTARGLIMRGLVWVEGQRRDKAGHLVATGAPVTLKESLPYVSRGGRKLEGALNALSLRVDGWVCVDLGSSTGGFTDCLIKKGARRVYAFDVGRGLMDWNLSQDERVILREGFNARQLWPSDVPEAVQLVVADLSFISLRQILPRLRAFEGVYCLLLIKPQFEARPEEVASGGIVGNRDLQKEIVGRIKESALEVGFEILGEVPSSVRGQKGNQEYFVLLRRGVSGAGKN
jgi:23S rRNA (cytidine1920-2'-O)/16S rRNA (cytidine1409-2'-O)-methyltransferase